MENITKIVLFKNKKVRKIIYKNEWWFSVADVCEALTDSIDSGAYWRKLKQRLTEEGNEVVTFCHGLKLLTPECVTGDTKLRRRRKKKGATGKSEDDLEANASHRYGAGYEYDEVRIDEIKSGDEILSINEKTGKLKYQKVKQLADMGVKPIFKLTTVSGKSIRTTGNHPYLVEKKSNLPNRKPKLGVFYDNSNMFYAQKQASWKVDLNKLKNQLQVSFDVKFINFYTAVPVEGDTARADTLNFLKFITPYVNLKTKPLKYIKTVNGLERKGDMDVDIALDLTENLGDVDVVLIVSGDSDLLPLRYYATKQDKKIIFAGFRRNMAWELTKFGKYLYLDAYDSSLNVSKSKTKNSGPELGVTLLSLLYSRSPSLSSGGKWIKIKDIKKGQKIAVDNGKRAIWDEIAKIETLPPEQVYDIEIENTHNFVGNDIIAHNTAIFGVGGGGNTCYHDPSRSGGSRLKHSIITKKNFLN